MIDDRIDKIDKRITDIFTALELIQDMLSTTNKRLTNIESKFLPTGRNYDLDKIGAEKETPIEDTIDIDTVFGVAGI